jgi:hypothetical protein
MSDTEATYVAQHYVNSGAGKQVVDSKSLKAMSDTGAWNKASEWSASSSGVLYQATHLRLLREDGTVVRERPLGEFH